MNEDLLYDVYLGAFTAGLCGARPEQTLSPSFAKESDRWTIEHSIAAAIGISDSKTRKTPQKKAELLIDVKEYAASE